MFIYFSSHSAGISKFYICHVFSKDILYDYDVPTTKKISESNDNETKLLGILFSGLKNKDETQCYILDRLYI